MLKFLASAVSAGLQVLVTKLLPVRCLASRLLGEVVSFPSGRNVAVGKLLAEGGFSFVYVATDLSSREQYALKKIICQDEDAKASSRAEAAAHGKFTHDNLLPLVDKAFVPYPSNPTCDLCWLLFPLCSGSLRDEITRRVLPEQPDAAWTVPAVVALLKGICRGLQEMHRLGVSHRDVKPENVLLQRDADGSGVGTPILMDFGSCGNAEVPISGRRDAVKESEIAAQLCTMQYRAPELFDVPSNIGTLSYALADVWSLGCTGYCCFIGYSPFEVEFDPPPSCRPRQVDSGHLRMLAAVNWPKAGPRSSIPAWLKDDLRWILTVDPTSRPSIRQVLERLLRAPAAGAAGSDRDAV